MGTTPNKGKGGGGGSVSIICARILGWVTFLGIIAVMFWGYYIFVVHLCFGVMNLQVWAMGILLIIYNISFILFIWTQLATHFAKPMPIPEKFKIPPEIFQKLQSCTDVDERSEILEAFVISQQLHVEMRTHTNQIRFCEDCQIIKPDRTHHCSVCGRCILKMDHHCPWVNNCVGWHNYKNFCLFVIYAFFYCTFGSLTSLSYFLELDLTFWKRELSTWPSSAEIQLFIGFIIIACFAISLIFLFGTHLYLLPRNKSTFELFHPPIFLDGKDKNAYHLGIGNNLRQIFGVEKSKWAFPFFTSLGNGISFPRRRTSGDNSCENGTSTKMCVTEYAPVPTNPPIS